MAYIKRGGQRLIYFTFSATGELRGAPIKGDVRLNSYMGREEDSLENNTVVATLAPPRGMSEDEFICRLLLGDLSFPDGKFEYEAYADDAKEKDDRFNSNSYVSGMLRYTYDSDGTSKTFSDAETRLEEVAKGNRKRSIEEFFPGWYKPVPNKAFEGTDNVKCFCDPDCCPCGEIMEKFCKDIKPTS